MALLGINNNENKFERIEKKDAVIETMSYRVRIVGSGVYHAYNSVTLINARERQAAEEYKIQVERAAAAADIGQPQNLVVDSAPAQNSDMPSEVVSQDQSQQQLAVSAALKRVDDSHERPLAA